MVASNLTTEKIDAGRAFIQKADASNMKIEAALWFYFQDQETWKLMLSVKGAKKDGPKSTYNKLQKIIAKSEIKEQLPLSEIVLAKPKSPLLDLLKAAIRTGPGISGIRFTGNVINGQLIPDAYIYRLN